MKQLFRLSILVLALLLSATATAYDFEVDGIYYDIEGTNASVTFGNNEYTGSVTIPATVTYNGKTYPVTAIGVLAFRYCTGLTGIDIPNSVTEIGNYAFEGCTGLTGIDIPNSVTFIGFNAFYNTGWYNNQPDGLVYAGNVAYHYKGAMPSGTRLTLKEGTLGIASAAFRYCTGLTSINIPNSVTEIGENAFYDTGWYNNQPDGLVYAGRVAYEYKGTMPSGTSMTLKEGTLGIAWSAFWDCTGLTSIVIPNSVTYVGNGAFGGCSGLTSIVVESGNPRYDSRNNCNAIIETANNVLIIGCNNTIIPNSVTEIGEGALSGCTGLTSIDIPNSVTKIGMYAFDSCTGLTSINIPNSVIEIGEGAFYSCTGLTDVYCYIADLSRVSSGDEQFSLDNSDYSGRTLHVLQGTADAYRADENWYPYFGQIAEDLMPALPGDVDGDTEVGIADVNALIDIILGGNGNTAAADVNGDGAINIADVNAIIDIILSGSWN